MSRRAFTLPDLGEGLIEAEIVNWRVDPGDEVAIDQPLVEVETDKAVVEVPSPYGGVLVERGAQEGETIRVGDVLAVYETATPSAGTAVQESDREQARPGREPPGRDAAATQRSVTEVTALPLVRRLASELGVDLTRVVGSGPGGRIERTDVEAARSGDEADRRAHGSAVWMSPRRRTIAHRMTTSWRDIPQLTAFGTADVTLLISVRDALRARHGVPISMTAMLCAAVAPLLESHPDFNAEVEGDNVIRHGRVDIGVAVDTDQGLLVPVLRDTISMTVIEIAVELNRLAGKARDRRLDPADMSGATFVLSNVGAAEGTWGHGTPLVPPGNTAIVATGRIDLKPAVVGGVVVPRPLMPVSVSFDHRLIDGAPARAFLSELVANIEEPALFLTR